MKRFASNISAIIVLACGIAFAAAVFALVDRTLLKPLPYDHPEQLVVLSGVTYPPDGDLVGYWGQAQNLSGVLVYDLQEAALNRSTPVSVCTASENMFDVLGVQPVLGRGFRQGKEDAFVAVLSHDAWRTQFSKNPDVLGASILLGGIPHVVIGVMGPEFRFIGNPEFYVRDQSQSSFRYGSPVKKGTAGTSRIFTVVGRLREGANINAARAEIQGLSEGLAKIMSESSGFKYGASMTFADSWKSLMTRASEPTLKLLMSCAALLLILTFLNVYSLILSQVLGKFGAFAIRLCYGASFGDIFRPVFRMASAIALPGVILGITASFWISKILTVLLSDRLPDYGSQLPDARVIGFAVVVGLLLCAGIAVGISLYIVRQEPQQFLLYGENNWLATRGGKRFLKGVVIAQIALSTLLLTVGISSWVHILSQEQRPLGFQTDQVVGTELIISDVEKRTPERIVRINDQLAHLPLALPGFSTILPMFSNVGLTYFSVEDISDMAVRSEVGGNYFQTMGIRLLAGRLFTDCALSDLPGTIIISRSFAEKFWETPVAALSQSITVDDGTKTVRTVIGVVDDVRLNNSVDQLGHTRKQFYLDYRSGYGNVPLKSLPILVFRGRHTPEMDTLLYEQLRRIDPALEIRRVASMDKIVADMNYPFRVMSQIASVEALAAVLVAVIGLYGFLSYMVQSYRREIGIRLALGASPFDMVRMIMRQGGVLALPGVGLGLLLSWWTTKLFPTFLSDAALSRPSALLLIAVIALVGAALGTLIPAIKAGRMEIYTGMK